jgi:hypothetical protein
MHIEKKSLFSKMAAPAAKSNSIHSRRVDLSRPAPAPPLTDSVAVLVGEAHFKNHY